MPGHRIAPTAVIGAGWTRSTYPRHYGGQGPSNVVPLRAVSPPAQGCSIWAAAQASLHAEDAATYGAWFHALTDAGLEANSLMLAAPTRFHATYVDTNLKEKLLSALRRVDPSVRDVRIVA